MPEWTVGDLALTSYPYGVDADSSVDVGEPDMVVEGVSSMIADGDIERVTRHGNRTYVLEVYVEGPSLGELAKHEAALRTELSRSGLTLTHDPGDSLSPASVYEVQTARLTPQRRDEHESHLIRKFVLTLTCAPFARSVLPSTTVAVLPPPETPAATSITTADTTAGFTAVGGPNGESNPMTVTDQGSYVQATVEGFAARLRLDYTLSPAVGMIPTPYLVVEVSGSEPTAWYATVNGESVLMKSPVAVRFTASGTRLYVFNILKVKVVNPVSPVLEAFGMSLNLAAAAARTRSITFNVHDVYRTDTIPQGAPLQGARTLEVGGTERTPGSLAISTNDPGTQALGMTIVHTAPDSGSAFPLRYWRVDGNGQASATNMSGKTEPLTSDGVVFDSRPWGSQVTPGNYVLGIRMTASGVGTFRINWTAETLEDATTQSYGILSGTRVFSYDTINTYQWVDLAVVPLPTVRINGGHSIRITLAGHSSNGTTPAFDEAWLFRGDDGCALTVLDGMGDYVWLQSADLNDEGTPTVLAGSNADGFGARYPVGKVRAQGLHEFRPPMMTAFVASEAPYPLVEFEHYHRWHSNAADEGGDES